jgi:hypothetical protein
MQDGLTTVEPDADDWRIAREVYRLFAAKPGSKYIAGEFGLAHLAALLRVRPLESVVEFGSGIGTITHLLLTVLPPAARIVCTERDAWCREQFAANLPRDQLSRVQLLPEAEPELSETFDLVIIDGPVTPGSAFLRPGTICFAEGGRGKACREIVEALAQRRLACRFQRYAPPWWRSWWRPKGCSIGIVQ